MPFRSDVVFSDFSEFAKEFAPARAGAVVFFLHFIFPQKESGINKPSVKKSWNGTFLQKKVDNEITRNHGFVKPKMGITFLTKEMCRLKIENTEQRVFLEIK